MNPMTNIKNVIKMNERELEMGYAGTKNSWHHEYRDSAWIFMGGMPYDLTEGDIIAVFSQYGEIVHINLVRDHDTGKSKGFGFLCYEDQRSTILAVDNLNGIKIVGRTIRVDHVQTYKLPKDLEKMDADRKQLFLEGCAPKPLEESESEEEEDDLLLPPPKEEKRKKKKAKKEKKKKSKKKKKKRGSSSSSEDDSTDSEPPPPEKKRKATTRSRSRSPDRRDRDRSPPGRDRDRSPPRNNRDRSLDRRDRDRSPPRRDRDRSPARRRSTSRERQQRRGRDRSRTPERRRRDDDRERRRDRSRERYSRR